MNEEVLIEKCIQSDATAQKLLYETYAPLMMSVCARYVKDRMIAEDVLQEGFIKVFTGLKSYTASGEFGGWIHRIFVNTALQYLRDNKKLNFHANIDEYEEKLVNNDYSILDKISADDLVTCIANLPDIYRVVFNLHAIEGYSHKEIAKELHIEESSSRSRYKRARMALQENLKKINVQGNAR